MIISPRATKPRRYRPRPPARSAAAQAQWPDVPRIPEHERFFRAEGEGVHFQIDFNFRVTDKVDIDIRNETLKIAEQRALGDYNELVRKYNALVHDYNTQRDLLIRLSATPLVLPPPPTFIHCTTFNYGSVGSIDCY